MTKNKTYKTYVTFGSNHSHYINGIIFDKDCVAEIETSKMSEGRKKVFEIFEDKFCFEYPEKHFNFDNVWKYFPRGIIKVPKNNKNY